MDKTLATVIIVLIIISAVVIVSTAQILDYLI